MMRYRTKGSFKGKGIMEVGDERSLCGEGGDRSQERKSSPRRPKHELLAVNGQVTARCIQPSSTRVQSGRGGQNEYMQDIQHSLNRSLVLVLLCCCRCFPPAQGPQCVECDEVRYSTSGIPPGNDGWDEVKEACRYTPPTVFNSGIYDLSMRRKSNDVRTMADEMRWGRVLVCSYC